jgi:hypothetical protein
MKLLLVTAEGGGNDEYSDPPEVAVKEITSVAEVMHLFSHWDLEEFFRTSEDINVTKALEDAGFIDKKQAEKLNTKLKHLNKFVLQDNKYASVKYHANASELKRYVEDLATKQKTLLQEVKPESVLIGKDLTKFKAAQKAAKERSEKAKAGAKKRKENAKKREIEKAKKLLKSAGETP